MMEFLVLLLVNFLLVLLVGLGLVILAFKIYEWYDDRFVDMKIGGYMGKQKYRTVKFILPPDSHLRISDMESFFVDAITTGGSRSAAEVYSEGKWHFNIAFEIVAQGGKIDFYMTTEASRCDLLLNFLKAYYPSLEFVDAERPLKMWPKEWWPEDGVHGYKGFRGADVKPVKTDLHPLKSWKTFFNREGMLTSDPIALLMNYLKTLPEDAIVVLQYVILPYSTGSRKKVWEAELKKLREEFSTNAWVEKSGATIQSLTNEEQQILNAAQEKMGKAQYKMKIRWATVYNKNNKSIDDGTIKKAIFAYFNSYSTSVQKLSEEEFTNTDMKYPGGKFGPFDAQMGGFANKIYWGASEQIYRIRRFYKGLVGKSGGIGSPTGDFYLDPESLASLFHFPDIGRQNVLSPVYANYTQGQERQVQGVVIQQYQPAFYLKQDGTLEPVQPGMSPDEIQKQQYPEALPVMPKDESSSETSVPEKYVPPDDLPV